MKIMNLLRIRTTLISAKQIVIIDLNSNAYSHNQMNKGISQIKQFYEHTAHILVYILDVTFEQKIKKSHDKCQKMEKNDNQKSISI